MPAKSAKQERFMQAVAHNPKFAAEAGVPQSVGKEFTKKRFAKGGSTAYIDSQVDEATGENAQRRAAAKALEKPGTLSKGTPVPLTDAERARSEAKLKALIDKRDREIPSNAKGGTVGFAKGGSIDGCAQRGKTRGKVV